MPSNNHSISHKQPHNHKTTQSMQKTIRVIAGDFKGLKLFAPSSSNTRATKSILKESCFNSIGNHIHNTCFIEGFGGSGSMGIEALSRGASEAIFFEQDSEALSILSANLSLIKKPINTRIIQGDSFQNLPVFLGQLQTKSILYLDPPFLIRKNYADIYKKCTTLINSIKNPFVCLIIIEHLSSYDFQDQIGSFVKIKQRAFGKSALSYFIKE